MYLVLDCHYLLHRTLHVKTFSGLANSVGVPTGATYGLLKSLRASLQRFPAIYSCLAVFDSAHSTRRRELSPDYKANRRKTPEELTEEDLSYRANFHTQKTYVKYILSKLGCRVMEVKGCEADDVIYWVSRNISDMTVVMSDDRDYFQMVDEKTTLYRPMADEVVTYHNFEEIYGLPYEKFLLARAIEGDPGDGIYGVKGAGPKTVHDVLQHASTFKEIEEYCKEQNKKRYLVIPEGFDKVKLNLQLLDLSLEEFSEEQQEYMRSVLHMLVGVSVCKVQAFFESMEFKSLLGDDLQELARYLSPYQLLR